MNALVPLASLLGLEVNTLAARTRRAAIQFAVVTGLVAVGAVFLLVALNAALSGMVGPVYAPLIIGGGAFVLALCAYGVMRLLAMRTEQRMLETQRRLERTALFTTAAASALPILLKSPLMRRIGLPVGSALAALYLLRLPHKGMDSGLLGGPEA